MTPCDSSVLYSLVDARQQHHAKCSAIVASLLPLVTTWPCLTEAMYLMGRVDGWHLQELLWDYLRTEILILHDLVPAEQLRMRELMEKYRDLPMDLADASLVVIAETLKRARVFTLDSHFRIYRASDGGSFEIVPE